MSDFSYNNRGLGTRRLYIAIAVWLALVLAGAFCTWYGAMGPGSKSEEQAAQATPTNEPVSPPTATTAVELPTAASEEPLATIPPAEEVFGYGIAIHGTGGGDVKFTMGQVESLGMGWVKQQLRWSLVELNPDEYQWGPYDVVADAADELGIKVMLSVVASPAWEHSYLDTNPETAPPDNLADYAEFVGRVVERYQGRIHAIEVWNEQNLDREWDTAEGVKAERYVEMLRLSYQAIKSRDPSIIVISGALSPVGGVWTDPNKPDRVTVLDDFDYFDQMIDAGFLDYCDCVGVHHNGYNIGPGVEWDQVEDDPTALFRGPFDNPHHSWSFKSTLWGYHNRIAAAGSSKPLCVTEFGWASAEGLGGHPPGFEFALDNTLEEQAQWDVQAFYLMRQWGFVRLAFLWNLDFANKSNNDPTNSNAPYSIVDFSGKARLAYGAIGQMEKR